MRAWNPIALTLALAYAAAPALAAENDLRTLRCHGETVRLTVKEIRETYDGTASVAQLQITRLPSHAKTERELSVVPQFWSKGSALMDASSFAKVSRANDDANRRELLKHRKFALYFSFGVSEENRATNDGFLALDGELHDIDCGWDE